MRIFVAERKRKERRGEEFQVSSIFYFSSQPEGQIKRKITLNTIKMKYDIDIEKKTQK